MKILSSSPTRISLFGGGSDVSPYADLYGGLVINMAINLRQRVTAYLKDDIINFNNGLAGPNHFPLGADPTFYYRILEDFGLNDMHQIKFDSQFDGLIESGIGSSASAAVALLGVINKAKELNLNRDQIANMAWRLEVQKLGLFGGKQDQYAATYGGINVMEFTKDGVKVTPLAQKFIEPLLPSLCLFYTGQNRKSAIIQEGFKNLTEDQIQALHATKALTLEALEPIGEGNVKKVGELLRKAWDLKKKSNAGVSNERIDSLYRAGLKAGALGGKILGAGGGGYILFLCPPAMQYLLKSKLAKLGCTWWDFSPDWNGLETRIL